MNRDFKIEIGNFREDYSIFYSEFENDKLVRELKLEVDIVRDAFYYLPGFKTTIIIYLDSFKNWNSFKELTLYEYTIVLKRVHKYLSQSGYNVCLE